MNDSDIESLFDKLDSIKYMKEQGVGIRKIATDLKVGVSTVYKIMEAM